eukprot:scaffold10550_cov271-Chaetoceros_neogracile.AAC.25
MAGIQSEKLRASIAVTKSTRTFESSNGKCDKEHSLQHCTRCLKEPQTASEARQSCSTSLAQKIIWYFDTYLCGLPILSIFGVVTTILGGRMSFGHPETAGKW